MLTHDEIDYLNKKLSYNVFENNLVSVSSGHKELIVQNRIGKCWNPSNKCKTYFGAIYTGIGIVFLMLMLVCQSFHVLIQLNDCLVISYYYKSTEKGEHYPECFSNSTSNLYDF